MMQKILKKPVPLPQRPKLPGVEEIIADVQRSEKDDVVFSILKSEENGMNSGSLASGDSFDDSTISHSSQDPADEELNQDIEEVYNKTVEFLKVTEELKLAPDTLKGQVQDLKQMGSELAESINELKRQSQTVLHQSLSTQSLP